MKLDLTGATSAPKTAASTHPVVVVDDALQTLCEQFQEIAPQAQKLEKQRKALSAQIGERTRRLFWAHFAGVTATSSTMLVAVGEKMLNLITQAKYSRTLTDDAPLRAAIGEELVTKWFTFATAFKIDFDKVPEAKQQEFATAIIKLAAEHECAEAVEAAQYVAPKPGFHEARTRELTTEQNLAVDQIIPVVAFPKLA